MPVAFAPLEGSFRPIKNDKRIIPIMSSKIAAAIIELPTFEFNFPSSFKAATVILTEVADSTAP